MTRRGRKEVSKALRARVFARDGFQCVYETRKGRCPVKGSPGDFSQLTIEHIVPLWLGGDNSMENLETMCAPHNQERNREVTRMATGTRSVRRREPDPIRFIDLVPGAWAMELMVDEGVCPQHGRWKSPRRRCPVCS